MKSLLLSVSIIGVFSQSLLAQETVSSRRTFEIKNDTNRDLNWMVSYINSDDKQAYYPPAIDVPEFAMLRVNEVSSSNKSDFMMSDLLVTLKVSGKLIFFKIDGRKNGRVAFVSVHEKDGAIQLLPQKGKAFLGLESNTGHSLKGNVKEGEITKISSADLNTLKLDRR